MNIRIFRHKADLMCDLHSAQDTVGLLGVHLVYRCPLRIRNQLDLVVKRRGIALTTRLRCTASERLWKFQFVAIRNDFVDLGGPTSR